MRAPARRHAAGRRWNVETVRLVPRMEQATIKLWGLGPRATLELLLEIGCEHGCLPDVAGRLARYSNLDREMMLDAGAVMGARRPRLVQGMNEEASQ